MNDKPEDKPADRSKSSDTWICPKCEFENINLLPVCEMCETSKPKTHHDLVLLPSSKQVSGFKCHKCSNITHILSAKCIKCGEVLIPEDSDEEEQKQIIQKKRQTKKLKRCPTCEFQNDESNRTCVACDSPMEQIRQFPIGFYPHSIKHSRQICEFCSISVPRKTMRHHLTVCPARLNSTEGYDSLRRGYCFFCYAKFDPATVNAHDAECPERKQFFKVQGNPTFQRMTKLQIDTVQYMHLKSEKLHWLAYRNLSQKIQKLGYQSSDLENLHHYIINYAPIIIHMHANNHMQFFVKDTHYRNQFETRKSSGSLSSTSRVNWEDRMFDRKHHDATPFERVKYGTINFTNDPKGVGVCSGYGKSYFLLKSHVRNRCTVTDMDSSSPSAVIGTFQFCFQVFNKIPDKQIIGAFEGSKGKQVGSEMMGTYKQIQIHGPVEFKKDIERVYICKEQITDNSILEMVKQFCKNNDLEYEIFQMPAPKYGGAFGSGGLFGMPISLAPPVFVPPVYKPSIFTKPKKTKATAHLFGGGSALPYFAPGFKPPQIKPQPQPQPVGRIIPDASSFQPVFPQEAIEDYEYEQQEQIWPQDIPESQVESESQVENEQESQNNEEQSDEIQREQQELEDRGEDEESDGEEEENKHSGEQGVDYI